MYGLLFVQMYQKSSRAGGDNCFPKIHEGYSKPQLWPLPSFSTHSHAKVPSETEHSFCLNRLSVPAPSSGWHPY